MSHLTTAPDVESAAKELAGNWSTFECFVWNRASDLDDANQWCIIYTHHRDSGLLDQSNAVAIERELEPFVEDDDPDVVAEHHNHWAVGWIDGFSIRVHQNGHVTRAFCKYHKLTQRLNEYPVLDEEHYSSMEYEATRENIGNAASSIADEYDLPVDWVEEVYSWLSDHNPSAVENKGDQGGWPEEDQVEAAFVELGYKLP